MKTQDKQVISPLLGFRDRWGLVLRRTSGRCNSNLDEGVIFSSLDDWEENTENQLLIQFH